jgi:hypothetical protein
MIGRRSLGLGILRNLPTVLLAAPAQPTQSPRPATTSALPVPHVAERVRARSTPSGRHNRPPTLEALARVAGVHLTTALAWRERWGAIPPRCRRALERAALEGA